MNGTYSSFKLDSSSANKLLAWARLIGIRNLIDPSEYHVTVVYSSKDISDKYKPFQRLNDDGPEVHISPTTYKLSTLQGKDSDRVCLVLNIDSGILRQRWDEAIRLGATWNYDTYSPHITISYDVDPDTIDEIINSTTLPDFEIILSHEEVRPLDLDWASKVKTVESYKMLTKLVSNKLLKEFTSLPNDIESVRTLLKSKGYTVTSSLPDGEGGKYFYASAQSSKLVTSNNQVEVHQFKDDTVYNLYQRGKGSKQLASNIDNLEGLMATINRVMNESKVIKEGQYVLHPMSSIDNSIYGGVDDSRALIADIEGLEIDSYDGIVGIYSPKYRTLSIVSDEQEWKAQNVTQSQAQSFLSFISNSRYSSSSFTTLIASKFNSSKIR